MKAAGLLASLAILVTPVGAVAAGAPEFAQYETPLHRAAKPQLHIGRGDLIYRTRYRALYDTAPNFGGHYAVSVVGCGTNCIFLLAVDFKAGKTVRLKVPQQEELQQCPEEYHDLKGDTIFPAFRFKPDSRLFVVIGKMAGNECGARYFVEKNGAMIQIRDVHLKASQ